MISTAIFLSFLLLVSPLGMQAHAEDDIMATQAEAESVVYDGVVYDVDEYGSELIPVALTEEDAVSVTFHSEIEGRQVSIVSVPDMLRDNNKVEEIVIEDASSEFISYDGVLYSQSNATLLFCPRGKKGSIDIPEGTVKIFDGAFRDCTGITSVKLPESLTEIGAQAFYGCTALEELGGAPVPMVGYDVFEGCSSLKALYFADGEGMERPAIDCMFRDCNALETLDLAGRPANPRVCLYGTKQKEFHVPSIGGFFQQTNSISNCLDLETVTFSEDAIYGFIAFGISDCPSLKAIYLEQSINTLNIENCPDAVVYCKSSLSSNIRSFQEDGIPVHLTDRMTGDLNYDEKVSLSDVIVVNRSLLALEELNSVEYALADVDGDGTVSPADALNILCYVIQLIDRFPINA